MGFLVASSVPSLATLLVTSWYYWFEPPSAFLIKDFGPFWPDSITQCTYTLDKDPVTAEAVWLEQTACHVKETSLLLFELCEMVHYPAGHHNTGHKGMDKVSSSTQLSRGI